MLEKMLEVLEWVHGQSPDTAKDLAPIIYRMFPNSQTQSQVETIILSKPKRAAGATKYKVYTGSTSEKSQKKSFKPRVAAETKVTPTVTAPVVEDSIIPSEPLEPKTVLDYATLTLDEVEKEFGDLKTYKQFLRDTFKLDIAKNLNFEAVQEILEGEVK